MKHCGNKYIKRTDFHNRDIFPHSIAKDSFRVWNGVVNQRVGKGQPGEAAWPFRQKNNFKTYNAFSATAQKFASPRPRDLLRLYNSLKKEIEETFTYAFYKFVAITNCADCNAVKFRLLTCEQFRTFFCRVERGLVKAIGWIVD